MARQFSTESATPYVRHRYWQEVIGNTYFHLNLKFLDADRFQGSLSSWKLGPVSLSRLESSALCYQRLRQHLVGNEEQFLVTIPEKSEVSFSQMGRSVRCSPGSFILERSDEPYEFQHARECAMWVLKVPGMSLRTRLKAVDRFCAMQFDSRSGVGFLFGEYVRLAARNLDAIDDAAQNLLGQQLIELLVAALEADPRILQSSNSAVRSAHLQRIERYMRINLGNSDLTPERIADACHVSTRYLHMLFKETGSTVSGWLRKMRLQAASEQLADGAANLSIADIAYRWGFSDQSQFCRAFREEFGCSPSQFRLQPPGQG